MKHAPRVYVLSNKESGLDNRRYKRNFKRFNQFVKMQTHRQTPNSWKRKNKLISSVWMYHNNIKKDTKTTSIYAPTLPSTLRALPLLLWWRKSAVLQPYSSKLPSNHYKHAHSYRWPKSKMKGRTFLTNCWPSIFGKTIHLNEKRDKITQDTAECTNQSFIYDAKRP